MARSIVVVDDEKLVMHGICALLSENDTDYKVAASFSSAEEALHYCMRNPPDILLTDIGMPGMNGLELIEKMGPRNSAMKIVVLSCHDEFDKVRKAFMLGADDYILKKDVDKENLYRVLNKVLPQTDAQDDGGGKTEALPLLSDIGEIVPESTGCLGIIGFKGKDNHEDMELIWQPDIPMLLQLIKDEIIPRGKFYLGLRNELVVFFPDCRPAEKNIIDRVLESARRSISKYVNRPVFIARYFLKDEDNMIEAYRNGIRVLDGMFYKTESSVLCEAVETAVWKNPLVFSMTESGLKQSWITQVEDFLTSAESDYIDPQAVKSELTFAVKHLLHHIQENSEKPFQLGSTGGEAYYQRIGQFGDLRRLQDWMKMLLGRISDNLKSGREHCGTVFKAKLFINENLQADLRLCAVADTLGVNAAHLSTIFKKETGLSYIEYVNTKRIEHACELLETTDYSAKEIAYLCGYFNPNYFSRIFKKLVNSTVSEYRLERNQ